MHTYIADQNPASRLIRLDFGALGERFRTL